MTALPFVLAGPIVRRADDDGVWLWFACSEEVTGCTPRLTAYHGDGRIYDILAPDNGWMRMGTPELRVGRLGEHLWVVLVKAKPLRGLDRGWFYGYELTAQTARGATRITGPELAYPPFPLPTFLFRGESDRLAQASCRRPGGHGVDAYAPVDAWLRRPERIGGITRAPIADTDRRPSGLILTGDQIYADDVAPSLFRAVQRLAADVFGYVERVPNWSGPGTVAADRIPDRKHLTARPASPIGFTTDDGDRHLLTFPEFAAMYLLVLNRELCSSYGVDDHSEALAGYADAVGACRRVLANVPTYMLLDDHEITDDWNMDAPWVRATANTTARRVIANGLAAYWAFQAWGNDPDRFDALRGPVTRHLDAVRTAHGEPGAAATAYDHDLHAQHWSFVTATSPPALCVDTRTNREFPAGKTAVLSGPQVWPELTALAERHRLGRGGRLLLVLPTPLLDHRLHTRGQAHYNRTTERYIGDYELYIDNPAQRGDLIRYLRAQFDPSSVVIFSGDVHIGYVADGLYAGGTRRDLEAGHAGWALPVVQVTASPIKNANDDARRYAFGENVIGLDERLFDAGDGTTVGGIRRDPLGMVARPVRLSGPLSESTFIWRNEISVVDLRSDHIDVLFVGGSATAIQTATASVRLAADVHRFVPPAPVAMPIPFTAQGAAAMSPYMQTAIEDAGHGGGAVAVVSPPEAVAALGEPIEGYVYDPTGTACATGPRPGATALLHELQGRFRGHSDGIFNCRPVRGGTRLSLHGEGRAVDWRLSASDSAEAAEADRIIRWLLDPDADGNADALARRMGIQEIIWNRRIWTARRHAEGFRDYTGVDPHTDHMHIGLSRAGAEMQTSHWRAQPDPPAAQALMLSSGSLHWDGATPEQLAFMRRVYDAHVARSARSRAFVDDVPAGELAQIEGGVRARTEAAAACRDLLAAARAALTAAKDAHDQRAATVERVSIVSGYRSASQQLHGWQGAFPTYYRETAAQRQAAPGGEHGEQAAELMVRYISARLGAPGFSLHNNGIAVDVGTREAGHDLGASTARENVTRWRASWLFDWLGSHAQAFGYRQNTHIDEPWHWEFDGRAAGAQAQQQGPSIGLAAVSARDVMAINDLPLLRDHHDVNPDLVLRWNAMSAIPERIDVVVHLHGFSGDRHLNVLARKLPLSGLDFGPPVRPPSGAPPLPAFTGRTRPTLCVLPRGKCADHPNDHGIWPYRFPAITRPAGFQNLLNEAITRFCAEVGASATIPIGRLILTAHSGGGAPLDQILGFTESLNLDPHEVHVFDALYGPTDNLERWLARRLGADAQRLAAGVPDPAHYLASQGGALRILYIDGAGTQTGSRRVDQAAGRFIPAGAAYAGALRDRYAAQRTSVGHTLIPYWYGGRLLADAGATIAAR